MTCLLAVSQSLYRDILQKICACLEWNRCQICPKGMDQRLLPTHATQIKTAFSWIALFLLKQSFLLVWVLHKIHILISLKCLLIICTIPSMENIKMAVLDSSLLSETWENARFNQSWKIYFFFNISRNCLAIACTFQILFCCCFCQFYVMSVLGYKKEKKTKPKTCDHILSPAKVVLSPFNQ